MAFQTGLTKQVRYKAESTFGTAPGASGAQLLRRVSSILDLDRASFASNEIQSDAQLRDMRLGIKSVSGNVSGELSPATYKDFMAAAMRSSGFTAGATTGALTNVTAAAGPPGTFTRAAGSYISDGFKVGDIVRWAGWATGGSTANNARNYRITTLSATVMTVGTAASGAVGQAEAVVAQAAGDSVTCTVVGKKLLTPPGGTYTDTSFAIEHWFPDISQSELYTGCKMGGMQVNLPSSGAATIAFPVMGQNLTEAGSAYYTTPTTYTTTQLEAAVNGSLRVGGNDLAFVTGISLGINANVTNEAVVGALVSPGVFAGRMQITGQLTALFQDQTIADYVINETEFSILAMLTTSSAINSDFVSFSIQRAKGTGGRKKNDSDRALVITFPFQALLNINGGTGTTGDLSSIVVQDSQA